jgi:hypothetical protein
MYSSGTTDFHAHDGLEQHRVRLGGCVLERHRSGELEGHFVRIDVVVRPVVQLDLHVVHRIAGEHAGRHRFLDALVDRLDEFPRDGSAAISFTNS